MPTKRGDFAIGVVGNKVICAGGLGKYSTIFRFFFIKVASHPQHVFQLLKKCYRRISAIVVYLQVMQK